MTRLIVILGGIVAGAVAAAAAVAVLAAFVWAGLQQVAGRESVLAALLIGLAIGLATLRAATGARGWRLQITAATASVAAITLGKLLAVLWGRQPTFHTLDLLFYTVAAVVAWYLPRGTHLPLGRESMPPQQADPTS